MRKKKLLHFNLKNMELNQLRQKIDKIDIELLKLFAERFEVVKKVGEWKKQNGVTNPLDPKRWKELLEKNILEAEKLGLSSNFVENVWEEIHKEALRIEK
ncbi:hypothetical protein D8B46_07465 [Candidatus Gracilibacteria bacterium]|nr:MAG: hypothetical protein D8B46_07465 [Candidatus Gracilibacteria bacterium]